MARHLIDIHCHTKEHSYDGKVPAVEIVTRLYKKGFAGVVITDHNYVWPDAELEALRREAQLPREFVLFSGQEVRTSFEGVVYGDLLVYGVRQSFSDATSPARLINAAKDASGFCIAPHPSVPRIGFGDHIPDFPILALESWNGRYGPKVEKESRLLAKKFSLPQVGGSDTHELNDIGGGATAFEEIPNRLIDIARMITAGAAKPWKPGMLDRILKRNDDTNT